MIFEILVGIFGNIAASIVYKGIKEIYKNDPFEKAFKDSIEKVRERHEKYFAIFDALLEKPEKFTTSHTIDKNTFCKNLSKEGVIERVSSELYDEINREFNKIIEKTKKKNKAPFQRYVEDELKKRDIKLEESSKGIYRIEEILTKINIPRMEEFLKKSEGKSEKPEFFRPSGPEWIDFKNDFIFERNEVDEIINNFNKKKLIGIKGKPASGKSVILRNIGYKLTKIHEDVHVIELKRRLPEIIEILKIQHGYLFIDDAHIDPEYVDDVVMKLSKSDVNILFSTRELEGRFGPTSPSRIPKLIKDAIEIKAYDAAEGIIEKFSEKRKKIPEDKKKELTENNLWILAWKLEAYEKYGKIDEDAVCNRVKRYIEKDLSSAELKDLKVNKAENVFLPLSVFYRYEIPIRYRFVKEFANNEDIENLIKLNEINKIEWNNFDYLTMHHSEIAEIFLTTFQKFGDLGYEVKKRIKGDWVNGLFHKYFQEVPEDCCWVVNKIYAYDKNMFENLVYEKNTINEILNGIENEKAAQRVGLTILNLSKVDEDKSKELLEKSLETIKNVIEKERNINGIGVCIANISQVKVNIAKEIVGTLDAKAIKNVMEIEENDIQGIGECITNISKLDKNKANEIVNLLNLEIIKDKIEIENNFEKIKNFIYNLFKSNRDKEEVLLDKARDLIDLLDLTIMKEKMEEYLIKENIPSDICIAQFSLHIFNMFELNDEKAKELVDILDLNIVKEKIEKMKHLENPWFLANIYKANHEKAKELIDILDIDILCKKIMWEESLENINSYIHNINQASHEKAKELVDMLNLGVINKYKIEKEEQVKNISMCIYNIGQANPEKAKYLTEILNLKSLENKIKIDEDIVEIGLCISTISKMDLNKAREILNSSFRPIRDKTKKEDNSEKTSSLISYISRIDLTKSVELFNLLDSNLQKEVKEELKTKIIPKFEEEIEKQPKEKERYIEYIKIIEELILRVDKLHLNRIST